MIHPKGPWRALPSNEYFSAYEHQLIPLRVLVSLSTMRDGSKWHHVSLSRTSRVPTWEELSKVKNDFLGKETEAYQVLAKESDHVNVHPNCLHLWARVDGQRCVANLQDIVDEVAG